MVQLTADDQAAAQLIEPHRLAKHPECAERVVERGEPAGPAEMSILAAETRREERANQVLGELHADHAFAEHEDVHVVVLHALVRGIGVVAQARANARDPVRGDRGAHGARGHDDAAVRPGFAKGLADGPRVVGTINRRAVHAHVEDLVLTAEQRDLDDVLEFGAGVVRTDCDAHGHPVDRAGASAAARPSPPMAPTSVISEATPNG